jgi:hypothetical protein
MPWLRRLNYDFIKVNEFHSWEPGRTLTMASSVLDVCYPFFERHLLQLSAAEMRIDCWHESYPGSLFRIDYIVNEA